MILTVCLIARNEEKNLSRALSSVAPVADHIVLVNTGSTDNTIQIAKSFGAHVANFPWSDDFSAARNFALDRAGHVAHPAGWILWLDADEELLPDSHPIIRQCMTVPDALAYMVLRRDLTDASRLDSGTEMWQLRLFRGRPDLRFRGRCHPDFHPPLDQTAAAENKRIYRSNIKLRHYGYIGNLLNQKSTRALKLLELELRDRPSQLYYLVEYGRTLLSTGDPRGHEFLREATHQIAAARENLTPPSQAAASLLEYLLMPGQPPGSPLNSSDIETLSEKWFPNSPPLLWLRAANHFTNSDFPTAAALLERLLNLVQTDTYDKSNGFDEKIIGPDANLNLAACYVRLGELEKAEAQLEKIPPTSSAAPAARQTRQAIAQLRNTFRRKH